MAAIDIDAIRAAAAGADLIVESVERTESTNRVLMDAPFGAEPAAPRLLAAGEQTAGRGRRGRAWLMEPGRSAAFSMALERWAEGASPAASMPIVVGLAVVRALAPHAPGLQLKWPNDLQRDGRKLGGILVEARRNTSAARPIERFVVGIGLNLLAPREAGQAIAQPVGGIFEGERLPVPAGHLVGLLGATVVQDVQRFLREGLGPFREGWQCADALDGEAVVLIVEGRVEAAGIARGIDAEGALLLETPQGLRAVRSGEVSVRRAWSGEDRCARC